MAIIRINQRAEGLALHQSPAPVMPALRRIARTGAVPVIVMVHGFQFRPEDPRNCPHTHIFADHDAACWKGLSWPRALGLSRDEPELGLAYGWDARGMIWKAYANAALAGAHLARALRLIRAAAPHRKIHAITHSLGARVVFQALKHLNPGDLGRIIALNPAEFHGAARTALRSPAGRTTEVIVVTGRENAGYNLMLEKLVSPRRDGDRALGMAVPRGAGRMVLRLDRADVLRHLEGLGFPIAPQQRRVCHWSPYLRDGALEFYGALMRQSGTLPLSALHPAAPSAQVQGGLLSRLGVGFWAKGEPI
ncbi:alpha/beta hydrolase [Alisedimentitalea sp. MJ-SS2]|uniref:alpha/beta hydrolase n=1 Tax=Aliisedimentitalea sp. MJ-SS2 TaxID=3049795 RepID=UPI0029089F4E|nr:alpha/beta hydrolase [Alisedimentitalea sp. MJ-SS2]MDU8926050.1 alpha/beta hydrolase [Alisedimentitalea sp. MJ-SS2]